MKRGRLLKEVNEVLPVAAKVIEWVKQHAKNCDQDVDSEQAGQEGLRHVQGKITIIDLCSGVGYLSMLLSELLAGGGSDGSCDGKLSAAAGADAESSGRSSASPHRSYRSYASYIARFVLVDNSFPFVGSAPKPHHVNPSHLYLKDFW
jgi:hypothetical protein